MRTYEELFIIKPDAPIEEVDAYIGQVKDLITQAGGIIDKEEKWGNRKLAYKVLKYNEGNYVLLSFHANPETIHEVERRMRVTDMVIKFITVRLDLRMKKIDKRRKHREKRAARRPPPQAAPPAMPGLSMPGAAAPAAALPGEPVVPAHPAPGHASPEAHSAPEVPVTAAVTEEGGE
ncbi:MAG: 30S ribosomal protein S6 [Acidobacteriota bacterium]